MRAISLGTLGLVLVGCYRAAPPPEPPPLVPAPVPSAVASEAEHAGLPRVVRRILKEEKDLVARSAEMARSLEDASGRARAEREANELAAELAAIETPIDEADSPALDELVRRLLLLSTRIDDLYDRMRAATARHEAVAVD